MKPHKAIPKFKTEIEERAFWEKHDSSDYINWAKAKKVAFSNLKPSTKTISIRLPEGLLCQVKILSNKYDVPYQSLIKILLAKQIKQENRAA